MPLFFTRLHTRLLTARSTVLFIALPIALCACLSTLPKAADKAADKDWLLNNPSQYPSQNYLLGRGQARSLEAAKDRARSDIAKQFRVDISALTSNRTEVNATLNAKGTQENVAQKTTDAVESRTDLALNGIEIVKTEKNDDAPDNARYAVLAVLNKNLAAAALSAQMATLDNASRSHLKEEQQAGPPLILTRIRLLSAAINAQNEKMELAPLLQVLRANADVAPILPIAELRARIQQLKNQVSIQLTLPRDPLIANAARTALAQSGLTVSTNGRYGVVVDATMNEVVQREQQFLATGNLSVRIEAAGELATSCHWILRRVAGSEAFAKSLLEKNISDDLTQFFNSVFGGPTLKECS